MLKINVSTQGVKGTYTQNTYCTKASYTNSKGEEQQHICYNELIG